tara:strand:- start:653 stop:2824 length:2172 start_codon:yes stop_codon:yes gene_type:complete
MKKIIINLFLFILILMVSLIVILSTIGLETNKFNKFISKKVSQSKNIDLNLDTIKFKIDLKDLSLFLETQNPQIKYRDVYVPIQNAKLYIDFLSLLKSNPKIIKTNLILKELDITQLKKLSIIIKPSNLKSLLNNKIKQGKLISEIDIYLNEQGLLKDFIIKGKVGDLEIKFLKDLSLVETKFSFFADKNDILIKNIFGNIEGINISDGDIKLNLENGIKLTSNFNSKIDYDERLLEKHTKYFSEYKIIERIKSLKAVLNNNLSIDFDSTYKVKDYNYNISGQLEKGRLDFLKPISNNYIKEQIKEIYFSDLKIRSTFSPNNISFNGEGKYSLNNLDFLKMNLESYQRNDILNLKLDFDYNKDFELIPINYKKSKDTIANLVLDLEKKRDFIKINSLYYEEGNNLIKINDFKIKNNNFFSFKKIEVKTNNNNFFIKSGKKIFVKGKKFDASNLSKFLSKQSGENKLKKINKYIEIDFTNVTVPMSEKLQNFKLIGEIKNGKFVKISSKGDFGGNNYLDISMKKDENSEKKYFEIYSDLTRPLLSEYSFFNGLSGGKLNFTSTIDNTSSISKLKIEDFKVINAPGVIKLLSLADLGGLADLAAGEGLSFDLLLIEFEKNKNFLKLNEILALGPSISVLMEGYQEENGLTSLRGTLVPAKTINKMISKIPVIGNIVIPKDVGEGLFGISFKMKGPKDQIKTTINPIRTLTPRFIQKIIDKNKAAK